MKDLETWQWAVAQVLAQTLREIHLHPYKIEGEPQVTLRRGYFEHGKEHVTIEFFVVPE